MCFNKNRASLHVFIANQILRSTTFNKKDVYSNGIKIWKMLPLCFCIKPTLSEHKKRSKTNVFVYFCKNRPTNPGEHRGSNRNQRYYIPLL